MKRFGHSRLVWLGLFLLWTSTTRAAEFRAGVSTRVVTPDPLLPVSGGVGPSHPATRKAGDLTVRALVLEEGSVRVAIVSVDFLGFPAVLGDRARGLVKGIPAENILIGATHTHSAPDCYGFPDERGQTSADLAYLDVVCRRIAEAVNEASSSLRTAAIRLATGEARGKIAYNDYAEQLDDPRCHVMQCVGPDGTPFATLVNYAVHPEVLGADAGVCSPDLVGPLCDRLAERTGGIGIFMNGALGGMVTADNRGSDGRDERTWEECQRIGQLLADEALRIVQPAPALRNPGLQCLSRTVWFPVDSPLLLAVLKGSPLGYGTDPHSRVSTRLNLINLGPAQILTIPGEALPNLGYYLKRKMRGTHNFLLGLTNDAFGYILARVDWGSFKRYNYITRTCLGEMTGEIFIEEAMTLVQAHHSSGAGR